ncbi:MAG: hypothetical protein PVJ60_03160 [Phycisphaerales bacterium]|jgi:hypothetical protein
MIPKKIKIILFCLLILLGAVMLTYGAFFHTITIATQVEGGSIGKVKSEPTLIKEASVSGVVLDKSEK